MHILITGVAGFIGFHLAKRLLSEGHRVTGLDSLNDYYSVQLKRDRLAQLKNDTDFSFIKTDLADAATLERLFRTDTSPTWSTWLPRPASATASRIPRPIFPQTSSDSPTSSNAAGSIL